MGFKRIVDADGNLKGFVIDRAKWGTGALLRTKTESGKPGEQKGAMCCIGFACRAFGVPKSALALPLQEGETYQGTIGFPQSDQFIESGKLPDWLTHVERARPAVDLGFHQDSYFGTAATEDKVVAFFAQHGLKVRFEGKFPVGRVPVGCKPEAIPTEGDK